jgi:hypothetical protein
MAGGQENPDPSRGSKVFPVRPPPSQYHYETRAPGIIATLSACIFIMITITGTRLWVRIFNKNLTFGLDDYLIIPGVVRLPLHTHYGNSPLTKTWSVADRRGISGTPDGNGDLRRRRCTHLRPNVSPEDLFFELTNKSYIVIINIEPGNTFHPSHNASFLCL